MGTRDDDGARAGTPTIPFRREEPRPINTRFLHVYDLGRMRTIIAREWRIEDVERCRRCPDRCHGSASEDGSTAMCLMSAPGHLTLDESRSFGPIDVVADGPTLDVAGIAAPVDVVGFGVAAGGGPGGRREAR